MRIDLINANKYYNTQLLISRCIYTHVYIYTKLGQTLQMSLLLAMRLMNKA